MPAKSTWAVTTVTKTGTLDREDMLKSDVASTKLAKGMGVKAEGTATRAHARVMAQGVPNSFTITRPAMLETSKMG